MRLLFVSGEDAGGAPRSTVELASGLGEAGHDVHVLLGSSADLTPIYSFGVRLAAHNRKKGWRIPVPRLLRRHGSRLVPDLARSGPGVRVWHCGRAENGLRRILSEIGLPDAVVVNSIAREQFLWIVEDLRRRCIPVALYMREEHSVTHLTISNARVDLVFGNSRHLVQRARTAGYEAVYAPSIVNLDAATVASTRRSLVLVNPVMENRPELLMHVAAERPDIHCVLQESWTLDEHVRDMLLEWTTKHRNLELRPRRQTPSEIFQDMRVLLATYPTGRPRVVLEAQHNGIPVVGLAQPSLVEAIGNGGLIVGADEPVESWVRQISRLWDDEDEYDRFSSAARTHANREEVDPRWIVSTVESALEGVVNAYRCT